MSQRTGILAGGNWIIDHVKIIDTWPTQDSLANIVGGSDGSGGSPYNVLVDLAKMGAPIQLAGVGLVGDDSDGHKIIADCSMYRINADAMQRTTAAPTSFTDVMTVQGTGRRTFFHARGANALLQAAHFDFTKTNARIFHLGYLLLLDGLDGAVARATKLTDFGGYLDIVADYVFYVAVPLGFACAAEANRLPAAALLASFALTGTSFLAFAAIAAKRGLETTAHGRKSIFYNTGLAEGGETILAFVLMCLWPAHFGLIALVFTAMCLVTALQRSLTAWEKFH